MAACPTTASPQDAGLQCHVMSCNQHKQRCWNPWKPGRTSGNRLNRWALGSGYSLDCQASKLSFPRTVANPCIPPPCPGKESVNSPLVFQYTFPVIIAASKLAAKSSVHGPRLSVSCFCAHVVPAGSRAKPASELLACRRKGRGQRPGDYATLLHNVTYLRRAQADRCPRRRRCS